jgi:four helix bundle protein
MLHGGVMQCSVRPIVQSYRDLIVWKKAMSLVLEIYRCTQTFPKIETYGLTSQLRRAAVSIPSNIAVRASKTLNRRVQAVSGNARGSLMEVETQIILAQSLGYLRSARVRIYSALQPKSDESSMVSWLLCRTAGAFH